MPKTEEELEHERDKDKLADILTEYAVDVIAVGANNLDARNLKRVLDELQNDLVSRRTAAEEGSKKRVEVKEAIVIWSGTEVAKLFAMSHNS